MIENLAIFGATGDVTKRYIFPALTRLHDEGCLDGHFSIVGVGRRDWTSAQFQEHISEMLGTHRPQLPTGSREKFLPLLEYARVEDLSQVDSLGRVFANKSGSWLIYLGLPPQLYPSIVKALSHLALPAGTRIIIEKPFGLDYAQSKELNRLLHRKFSEDDVYRIDHFLGIPTVFNILGLRFDCQLFEPIWNRCHIKKVEVIWDETLALEGRADYYDRAGALKDMIQNHLLQMLVLLAIEPLESIWSPEFRDNKVKVLRSVRKLSKAEIQAHTTRATYQSGRILGKPVSAYAMESGVVPERKTETFAQVSMWVDNERWQGVPFILRSGKALKKERKEILIHFKNPRRKGRRLPSKRGHNILHFNLDTDEMNLELLNIEGGAGMRRKPTRMDAQLSSQNLPPYARLFLEAMSGNSTLFIRNDEVEEMWNIVQPIADSWGNNLVPLQTYRAGSLGPSLEGQTPKPHHLKEAQVIDV
ncbi:MAG: glucose-6-phosphate dehydrogenase [Nitrospirales bacterium]